MNDRNLATSAQFSQRLHTAPFHGISHKQVRNILFNAGLCSKVVPLDPRWQDLMEEKAALSIPKKFGRKDLYIAVENVLRRARMAILQGNPDFVVQDLSTLDAVVSEYFD